MTDSAPNDKTHGPRLDAALDPVLDHLDADTDAALARLFELMRCQSVSTDPAYAPECRRAATWLAEDLADIGLRSRLIETEGHPLVLGQGGEGAPHLLFYGHYDVQPVDPLELWDRPPFEPEVITRADGSKCIHGRGAADDKGQLMTFLEALRAFQAVSGRLPCRITVLLEGEEESGGRGLSAYLATRPDELKADIALVCDTNMWNATTPAICTMLRGMVSEEVTITGPSRDLHSGYYGGAAINPIRVLTRILADLHDGSGRVTLEGFYDGVPEIPADIRAGWEALGFDDSAFLGAVGLSRAAGETGIDTLSQTWARPTAEVNGIWGGYIGAGFKTVIPSQAHAKLSFRLVGEQNPDAIRDAFRAHVEAALPPDCTASFIGHGNSRAIMMPTDAAPFARAQAALSAEWGVDAPFIGGGGSIPVVGEMKRLLGVDSLLIGFGLGDDQIHAPNEKYELRSFTKGARSWARIVAALAA